jgi:hypothetical protein
MVSYIGSGAIYTEVEVRNQMNSNEITLKVRLELDEQWASNHEKRELVEYLKLALGRTLGFRGTVKRLSIVKR